MPILKIPIPKGRLGVKLADGPDTADTVVIDNILDDSVMKGKKSCQVTGAAIALLLPLMV